MHSRIDYILASGNLDTDGASAGIGECVIFDHAPVTVVLWGQEQPFRSRTWRLNNYLLESIALE